MYIHGMPNERQTFASVFDKPGQHVPKNGKKNRVILVLNIPGRCAILSNVDGQNLSDNRIGESYNGSITVSKTVHGGSNPSSPAQ